LYTKRKGRVTPRKEGDVANQKKAQTKGVAGRRKRKKDVTGGEGDSEKKSRRKFPGKGKLERGL